MLVERRRSSPWSYFFEIDFQNANLVFLCSRNRTESLVRGGVMTVGNICDVAHGFVAMA